MNDKFMLCNETGRAKSNGKINGLQIQSADHSFSWPEKWGNHVLCDGITYIT